MRPHELYALFSDITRISGVGKALAQKLVKLDIKNIRDLIWHLPVAWMDRRFSPPLANAPHKQVISVIVEVMEHRVPRRHGSPYYVMCGNDSGTINLVFFNVKGDYLERQLPVGSQRIISGVAEWFNGALQMSHPDYIAPPEQKSRIMVLEPVYPLTAGISNRQLRAFASRGLELAPTLPEWIEAGYLKSQHWLPWKESLRVLHGDVLASDEQKSLAGSRVSYDEILANQLALAIIRRSSHAKGGVKLNADGALRRKLIESLPFKLTGGQQQVLGDIYRDVSSGQRMMRLLQGDVGSGKTVIALLAMLAALEENMQAALMAPTEIVCRQHYNWISRFAADLGVEVGLLTGSEKGAARKKLLARLAEGEPMIIVGTHAMFQEAVGFSKLAMVVVDEQHRFGVNQRLALSEKADNPHMLMMSATPIPRSLTMTLFGDMEISRLTEKPPGRKPIDTRVMPLQRFDDVVSALKRAFLSGARAYWVCPLIEATETSDLSAVEERYAELSQHFPGRVGIAHGRQSAVERNKIMAAFAAGELDLLLATTVIEVGVDVSQATIMVIEHAERFGLAQLHQLRGRVGRGEAASSCLLLYGDKISENGKQRLKVMRDSEDGFFIAEEDLRLRGSGEILGTRQSGAPEFRFADLYAHHDLFATARDDVKLILQRDAKLASERGAALRILLYLFEYDRLAEYAAIG